MGERQRERRRIPSEVRTSPPSSPANVLILVVVGVLAASALAAALLGGGHEETTPHGQVLASLQRVAAAQEAHHRATGSFAEWAHTLDVAVSDDVRITIIRGDGTGWEATAAHPAGLLCAQSGSWDGSKTVVQPPVCYPTGE